MYPDLKQLFAWFHAFSKKSILGGIFFCVLSWSSYGMLMTHMEGILPPANLCCHQAISEVGRLIICPRSTFLNGWLAWDMLMNHFPLPTSCGWMPQWQVPGSSSAFLCNWFHAVNWSLRSAMPWLAWHILFLFSVPYRCYLSPRTYAFSHAWYVNVESCDCT